MTSPLSRRLADRIRREGPIPFDQFVEAALYDPTDGFFSRGGGAGRAGGDFITSPEVGSTFGALVARALDGFWDRLGRPDPYVVVDAGAGRGQLARDVLRAEPACLLALRYVMVERSASLRALQHDHLQVEPASDALGPAVRSSAEDEPEPVPDLGPIVTALAELPAEAVADVIVANELLDNLPFRLVERGDDGWLEVRVGVDDAGRLVEVTLPADADLGRDADDAVGDARDVPAPGARLPVPTGIAAWVHEAARALRRGFVVLVDYADEVGSMVRRSQRDWLRTYRAHDRGAGALDDPGEQDITCDVLLPALRFATRRAALAVVEETSQAEWLRGLGLDDLVAAARATWHERAHLGDLEAVKARSIVQEAEALTDPAGFGAHRVIVLSKGLPPR